MLSLSQGLGPLPYLLFLMLILQNSFSFGQSEFPGFHLYNRTRDFARLERLPEPCKAALTGAVKCDPYVQRFRELKYRGSLNNATLTNSICNESCGSSLESWFDNVSSTCAGHNVSNVIPTRSGGIIWAGWNETCVTDPDSGKYCNDVISNFTVVPSIGDMPKEEMCSFCYVERLEMMQRTPYSIYNARYKKDLELVHSTCDISGPTEIPPPLVSIEPEPTPICSTGNKYTTSGNETCDSIALKENVSSASLFLGNQGPILDCSSIPPNTELCLPLSCQNTYTLKSNDTCTSIEVAKGLKFGTVRSLNPWLSFDCMNLQAATSTYGHVLCLSPQGGQFTGTAPIPGVTGTPGNGGGSEYTDVVVAPPANSTVSPGTTQKCGRWHVAEKEDTCTSICVGAPITFDLFLSVNPALKRGDCAAGLVAGNAYCSGPIRGWDGPDGTITSSPPGVSETKAIPNPS